MKTILVMSFLLLTASCSSSRFVDDVPFLLGPVDVSVEVLATQFRFDSAPDRYAVEFRVLAPEERRDQVLHFVVDGISRSWRQFIVVGTRWKIHTDRYAFERGTLPSFWKVWDLNPVPLEEPNKTPEPTIPAVTIRADARPAPAGIVAHL